MSITSATPQVYYSSDPNQFTAQDLQDLEDANIYVIRDRREEALSTAIYAFAQDVIPMTQAWGADWLSQPKLLSISFLASAATITTLNLFNGKTLKEALSRGTLVTLLSMPFGLMTALSIDLLSPIDPQNILDARRTTRKEIAELKQIIELRITQALDSQETCLLEEAERKLDAIGRRALRGEENEFIETTRATIIEVRAEIEAALTRAAEARATNTRLSGAAELFKSLNQDKIDEPGKVLLESLKTAYLADDKEQIKQAWKPILSGENKSLLEALKEEKVILAKAVRDGYIELLEEIPEEYFCPISGLLLVDPVADLAMGGKQFYTQPSIMKHLEQSGTSPFNQNARWIGSTEIDKAKQDEILNWVVAQVEKEEMPKLAG